MRMFLSDQGLRRVIKYFCDTSVSNAVDPILETLSMMLTTPLHFCITRTGVTFWKNKYTYIYPFQCMTEAQLDFVQACVDDLYGVSCVEECTARGVQMVGGCIVRQRKQDGSQPVLDTFDVLGTFCSSVFGSKLYYSDPQVCHNICNIVIQRVCGNVQIHKSVRKRLFEWCDELRDRLVEMNRKREGSG